MDSVAAAWYLGRLSEYTETDRATEKKVMAFLESVSTDDLVEERIDTTLVNMFWSVEE